MYRVALSVAHGKHIRGKFDPGCRYNGVTEYSMSQAITFTLWQMMQWTPEILPALVPPPSRMYPVALLPAWNLEQKTQMINRGGEAGPFDLAVEIHLNDHGSDAAGTEVWCLGAEEEAAIFQRHLVHHLGTRDRGVRKKRYYFLRATKPKALIVEVAFIKNVWEMCANGIYHAEVALACYRAIMEITGSGAYSYGREGQAAEENSPVSLTLE